MYVVSENDQEIQQLQITPRHAGFMLKLSLKDKHSFILCILMDSVFWFDKINLEYAIVHIRGVRLLL